MTAEPVFDDIIHSPVRLRICGLLRAPEQLEFAAIRDTLGVSDTTLSKNLKVLAQAGFVLVDKGPSPKRGDARRLTWVALTGKGRGALEGHLAALARIAAGTPGSTPV
ncbi:transcriptional regulator [Gulosibacter sp. 10]|uniref:transcriptional regulator n=1 Tax=Gulosibacter sp. 10 TaxID=1255570 RepID=UPI00097F0BC8|nr:transcriptional regulator [Gulosibacter sp. 10]SJM66036.1 Transcriptional regulator [Gulosibacter sp. 10]